MQKNQRNKARESKYQKLQGIKLCTELGDAQL